MNNSRALEITRSIKPIHLEVIDDDLAEVLRGKSPAERIQMVWAANRTARLLATAGKRLVCGGTA